MVLMIGKGDDDPLFLQFKEAQGSVLEPYGGREANTPTTESVSSAASGSSQAASDLFLGWVDGPRDKSIHYYFRQLRDMKGTAPIEKIDPASLQAYAWMCGAVLARAHACSGDAQMLTGYLGNRPIFDDAVAAYGVAYADVAERDFEAFTAAIASGRLQATTVDPTRP